MVQTLCLPALAWKSACVSKIIAQLQVRLWGDFSHLVTIRAPGRAARCACTGGDHWLSRRMIVAQNLLCAAPPRITSGAGEGSVFFADPGVVFLPRGAAAVNVMRTAWPSQTLKLYLCCFQSTPSFCLLAGRHLNAAFGFPLGGSARVVGGAVARLILLPTLQSPLSLRDWRCEHGSRAATISG